MTTVPYDRVCHTQRQRGEPRPRIPPEGGEDGVARGFCKKTVFGHGRGREGFLHSSARRSATSESPRVYGPSETRSPPAAALSLGRAARTHVSRHQGTGQGRHQASPQRYPRRPGHHEARHPPPGSYDNAQDAFKVFLVNIIRDAITYSEHAHRRLVTVMDVVLALKRNGHTVYGFGNPA